MCKVAKYWARVFCNGHYDDSQKSVSNLSAVEDGNLRPEMIVIIDTNHRSGLKSAIRC